MKSIGIIPARYASSRFPGKPLVKINGKEMILHTVENALKANLDLVVVATDDIRIYNCVKNAGYVVEMTSDQHESGTDRVAEITEKYADYNWVVNIQGDEPFVSSDHINPLLSLLKSGCAIASLCIKISSLEELSNPNKVKVVLSEGNNALYFSRQAVPFIRDFPINNWLNKASFYKHIGMYAFQRETLLSLAKLPVSNLEKLEKLEQLRWLENNYLIHMHITNFEAINIDTQEDLNLL